MSATAGGGNGRNESYKIPRPKDEDMMEAAAEAAKESREKAKQEKKEREYRELMEKAAKDSKDRRTDSSGDGTTST